MVQFNSESAPFELNNNRIWGDIGSYLTPNDYSLTLMFFPLLTLLYTLVTSVKTRAFNFG